jgi:hypothetical protein
MRAVTLTETKLEENFFTFSLRFLRKRDFLSKNGDRRYPLVSYIVFFIHPGCLRSVFVGKRFVSVGKGFVSVV